MIEQQGKQIIDIGEVGNASTGDILYDGGDKINSNFDAIYNAFGDQRYSAQGTDEGNQTIHATGYYQKVDQTEFRTPVPIGSMYDVDATAGAVNPILSKGKRGECVVFINSNGTVSVNRPLVIQPSGSFVGISGGLTVTSPYCKVICWCVADDGGEPVWNYSIESMFGQKQVPVEGTYALTANDTTIRLAHTSEYNAIKLLVLGVSNDGKKFHQAEVNLLIDHINKKVYATEFAVLRIGNTSETDNLLNIDYSIDINGNVNMLAKTTYQGVKLSVKSIATQKIGSA